MIYFLLSDNGIIWHIVGYILYEIILIPILYIVQYLYWIFITIITTNPSRNIFHISESLNNISDNFSSSPIFIIYVTLLGISILSFLFIFIFNMIKDQFTKNTNYAFVNNIKWFIITLILFPLIPVFFCLMFLLSNIFFHLLGMNNNKAAYLTNQQVSSFNMTFNEYKNKILSIWTNKNLNEQIINIINTKLNINSFYYQNLVIELNNYETYILNNQNIFNELNNLVSNLQVNQNNLNLKNNFQEIINSLNSFNNNNIDISYDLQKLNYTSLDNLKNQINLFSNYFDGTLIYDLLFNENYSINNIIPYLGDINNFNLIYIIESLSGNNSKIIDLSPNFYKLNWNVLIAIIFAIFLLIILILYSLLEIRRIVEIVALFLISPLSFVINNDDRNYYFSKWFKTTINKFFGLLIIALIFETAITIYPYITNAIISNLQYHLLNKLIVSCICGIGILLASFTSTNTILNIFDAKEDLMQIMSDYYGLHSGLKILPFKNKAFKKKWLKEFNNGKVDDNYKSQDSNYSLSAEDILYKKIPVPTVGFENFMSHDSTHKYIKNLNNKLNNFLFTKWIGNKTSFWTNKLIENKLRQKYKKYKMVEQKWRKQRQEGPF